MKINDAKILEITKACEKPPDGACALLVRRRMRVAGHNSKMKLSPVAAVELREAACDDVIVANP